MKMTYGERLLQALTASKKTRSQLAEKLGISEQAVGQVILGNTKAFSAENSARAARFLEVDDLWLATGEGEPAAADRTRIVEVAWPFPRVTWQRVARLSAEELAFVEAKLETELTRAEERLAGKLGAPVTPAPGQAFRDPSVAEDQDYFLSGTPPQSQQIERKRTG